MSALSEVGTTITRGIQDTAAVIPLLGTAQCEKHVGSALKGGYLYAAATPLSIFGSLGVVKFGVSVLISCISIHKPSFSFKLTPYPKLSVTFRGRLWSGAKILDNAGFKPVGTATSLIAMDGTRYTAETLLMQIIKEKHIDPERLFVEWKSTDWNVMLVIYTTIAAVCSFIPYTALISPHFKLSVVHSPWIFPLLRIVGSCLAAVCCQFLIQTRVISLMKNRIMFMIMNRMLVNDLKSSNPDLDIHEQNAFQWDESRPSEECLWNLEQYLCSQYGPNDGPGNLPIFPVTSGRRGLPRDVSTKVDTFEFAKPYAIHDKLRDVRNEHIRTSSFHRAFIFISWTIVFLSLPATVAGYIGCFTLVSRSHGNGPLIWLLLEAALSTIRIVLWAQNPSFDKMAEISVMLNVTGYQPLVTTEKNIEVVKGKSTLASERQFLE
jgi:hypothetical protein